MNIQPLSMKSTRHDVTLRNSTESHELRLMRLMNRKQTVFDGTLINPESQYMELKQLECVYETVRVEEQEVCCQKRCY